MIEEQRTGTEKKRKRGQRRVCQAVVVSDKRDKTIKVLVESLVKHMRYGKYIRQRTTMHVHDEKNEARVGDKVEIAESRPISKTKNWRLVRVIERAEL